MNEVIEMVNVTSMVNCTINLILPEYHYERTWPRKGVTLKVRKDYLVDSFYQTGVENLFKMGFLYCEDKDTRILLGLEEEDGTSEIAKLDDKLLKRIIGPMPVSEVEKTFEGLTPTQREEVARYAVENINSVTYQRVELLSKLTGVKITKAVELKEGLGKEA